MSTIFRSRKYFFQLYSCIWYIEDKKFKVFKFKIFNYIINNNMHVYLVKVCCILCNIFLHDYYNKY